MPHSTPSAQQIASTTNDLPAYLTHPHCDHPESHPVHLICNVFNATRHKEQTVDVLVPLAIAGSMYQIGRFISRTSGEKWIVTSVKAPDLDETPVPF